MVAFGDGAGSPMLVRVINPAGQMSLVGVGVDGPVQVGQPVVAVINTQGVSIKPADLEAIAKGCCSLCECKKGAYVLYVTNVVKRIYRVRHKTIP